MKSAIIAVVVLIILGVGGYFGVSYLSEATATEDDQRLPDLTATVTRTTIENLVDIAGDISPAIEVDVKPEVSAKIKKIHVKVGQDVKAGMLILELDDNDLLTEKGSAEIEISSSKADMDQAARDFDRNKRLHTKGLVSDQILQDSETALLQSKNSYSRAEKRVQTVLDRIEKTKVYAPIDGTVLSLPVVEGQVVSGAANVSSGTLLMTLADLTKLLIVTHVNQVDIARIEPDMEMRFRVDSLGEKWMKGKVYQIYPIATVKNNVKGFKTEMYIEELDPRLRPGMTANVEVPTGKVENVLAVPLSAVFREGKDKKVAFVESGAGDDKTVETRELEIGVSNIDFVEIKSGLNENETVLLMRPKQKPGA